MHTPFDIRCDHHTAHECDQDAHYVVKTHQTDMCNDDAYSINGDKIELLCDPCLTSVSYQLYIAIHYAQVIDRIYPCKTCNRPVQQLADILEAQPIHSPHKV